jgi:anion-transporting  ArsA/GET3 family ATPase
VGKTTVCAAFTRLLCGQGRRVLVVTSDPKERLSKLLGVPALGPELEKLGEGLWGVNIEPEHALRDYGRQIFKSGLMNRAVFDNRYVQNFFAAVPGLYQWSILGKAWFHSTELRSDGNPRFHTVIFDAPATGHALEMLWVPKIITRVARSGRLFTDADRALSMLQNPEHSAFCVVNLPEDVPTLETEELVAELTSELGLPVRCVVQNARLEEKLTAGERDALVRLAEPLGEPTRALCRRAEEEIIGMNSWERLHKLAIEVCLSLPRLIVDATTPASIALLERALGAQLAGSGQRSPEPKWRA